MPPEPTVIALGKRLRSSAFIPSVGVRADWDDYPPEIQETIRGARVVFYPSILYQDVFRSVGKRLFPRNYYRFMGNKILQTQLFQLLEISHPRTRLFYGRNPLPRIAAEFEYPFITKNPLGSSKGAGVYLIREEADLVTYLETHRPAYVQEYLPIDRDLRVVLLNGAVIHAYWRIQRWGSFGATSPGEPRSHSTPSPRRG